MTCIRSTWLIFTDLPQFAAPCFSNVTLLKFVHLHISCPISTITPMISFIYCMLYKYFWDDLILNLCVSRDSPEKQNQYVEREIEEIFLVRTWLLPLWRLTSPSGMSCANGVVPTWMLISYRARKSQSFSSRPKSRKWKQNHHISKQTGRKNSFYLWEDRPICSFYSDRHLINKDHPH